MNSEKKGVSLVILTFNEIEGVRKIFSQLPLEIIEETFVVDGNSTDGTIEFFESKGIPVYTQSRAGRAEAFRVGIEKSKYENIIFFSPDGNENPSDIIKIAEQLQQGYDMVIASRFMKGARNEEDNKFFPFRKWANQIFTLVANILWNNGKYITDTINGFRGLKKNTYYLLKPDVEGFVIEYQLSIRAMKSGLRIKEIPTIEGDRIGGKTKAKSLPVGFSFLRFLIKEIFVGKKF